jgi:hypothetical protein
MLQSQKFLRSFVDKSLDGILIAQPIAARDGVVAVLVDGIVGFGHSGGATLRGNRMATHGIDLRNYGDSEMWIGFSNCDGCAQTCSAATNEQDIVGIGIHGPQQNPRSQGTVREENKGDSSKRAKFCYVLRQLASGKA